MKLEIKNNQKTGRGVFAGENINNGQIIRIFTGEICTNDKICKRIKEGKEKEDDPLQVDIDEFLDIDDEISYCFNHSCDPNAGMRKKNELFAIKDIKKGEEITYDYSTTVGININNWAGMNCNCGSNICRKHINDILTLSRDRVEYYYKLGALPNFIKKQLNLN